MGQIEETVTLAPSETPAADGMGQIEETVTLAPSETPAADGMGQSEETVTLAPSETPAADDTLATESGELPGQELEDAIVPTGRTIEVHYILNESTVVCEVPVEGAGIVLAAAPESPDADAAAQLSFIGWQDESSAQYEAGAVYPVPDEIESLRFTAVYAQVQTRLIRVRYAVNDDAPDVDLDVPIEDGVIVLARLEEAAPDLSAEALADFKGWKDEVGELYAPGARHPVSEGAEALAFTAEFALQPSITVVAEEPSVEIGGQLTYVAVPKNIDLETARWQWQRSSDAKAWTDVPGETSLKYTYVVDEENSGYIYRVIALLPAANAPRRGETADSQSGKSEDFPDFSANLLAWVFPAAYAESSGDVVIASNFIIAPLSGAYADGIHVNPLPEELRNEMGDPTMPAGSESNLGTSTSPLLRLESGIQKAVAGALSKVYLWFYYRPYTAGGIAESNFSGKALAGYGLEVVQAENNNGYLFLIKSGEPNWTLSNFILSAKGTANRDIVGMVGGKLALSNVAVNGSIHFELASTNYTFADDKDAPLTISNPPSGAQYVLTFSGSDALTAIQGTQKRRLPLVKLSNGMQLGADVTVKLDSGITGYKLVQIGSIVYLMQDIDYNGVFISGSGDDAEDGSTPFNPVQTWARAVELLDIRLDREGNHFSSVYVVGQPVAVKNAQTWSSDDVLLPRSITVQRYDGSSKPYNQADYSVNYSNAYKSGALIDVQTGGTLTLKSLSVKGLGNAASNSNLRSLASLVNVTGGKLILGEDAELSGNWTTASTTYKGGAVYASSGTVEMQSGSAITDNYAYYGGGLYLEGNTSLTVDGAMIHKNSAYYAGAIYLGTSSDLTANNMVVSENTATNYAAICLAGGTVADASVMRTVDCVFTKNTATSTYGALCLFAYSTLTDTRGAFTENSCGSIGAAIYGSGTGVAISLTETSITGNKTTSTSSGGMVYTYGTSTANRIALSMDRVTITGNTGYGTLYTFYTDVSIIGTQEQPCVISDNTGTHYAGMYLYYASLNMCWTKIERNTSTGTGAGIYSQYPLNTTNIDNCSISENTASGYAGFFSSWGNSNYSFTTTISNSTVSGNTATGTGYAGIYFNASSSSNAPVNIINTEICDNRAAAGSAGLYTAMGGGSSYFFIEKLTDVKINRNVITGSAVSAYAGIGANQTHLTMRVSTSVANEICNNAGPYNLILSADSSSYIETVNLANTKVTGNKATNSYGATIYANNVNLTLLESEVLSNQNTYASLRQHLYTNSWTRVTIDGKTQIGNAATPQYIYLSSAMYPLRLLSACENGNLYWLNVNGSGTYSYKNGDKVVVPCTSPVDGFNGMQLTQVGGELDHFQATVGNPTPVLPPKTVLADSGGSPSSIILIHRGVYVDGVNGSDAKGGTSPLDAVKTFDVAKQKLTALVNSGLPGSDYYPYIYVVNAISPQGTTPETWSLAGVHPDARLMRYGQYTGAMISVAAGRTLTLQDVVADGGKDELGYSYTISSSSTAKLYTASAIVTVSGGTFTAGSNAVLRRNSGTNASYAGGIYASSGNVVLSGATVSENASQYGGGIAFGSSGTLQISNSTIKDNASYYGGGGLYVISGTFAIDGTSVLNNTGGLDTNTSNYPGGGLYASNAVGGSIRGCTFAGNKALASSGYIANGGAVAWTSTGKLIVANTLMENNIVSSNGSAIYASKGFVAVEGGGQSLYSQIAGDIYVEADAQLGLGGDVRMPEAPGGKPVIYLKGKPIRMTDDFVLINSYLLDLNSSYAGEIVIQGNDQIADAAKYSAAYPDGLIADNYLDCFSITEATRDLLQQDLSADTPHIVIGIFHVYLKTAGDDANSGATPETAVKTFARAAEILKKCKTGANIIICGVVTIAQSENWSLYNAQGAGGEPAFENNAGEQWKPLVLRYSEYGSYLISLNAGVSLSLDKLTLDGNAANLITTGNTAMIQMLANSALTVEKDAVLRNNRTVALNAAYGGAVYSIASGVTITVNGTIRNNSVTNSGTSGSVSTYGSYGGAIYASSATGPTITVTGVIADNSVDTTMGGYGGAIYAYGTNSKITLSGAQLEGNTIKKGSSFSASHYVRGGACYIEGTGAALTVVGGSSVKGNGIVSTANYCYGGAFYVTGSKASVAIRNSTVASNSIDGATSSYGGALYANLTNGTLAIEGSAVTNNSVRASAGVVSGGAVYLNGYADGPDWATVTDSDISSNSVTSVNSSASGAGLYVSKTSSAGVGQIRISDSTLKSNAAIGYSSAYGGGAYILGYSTAAMSTVNILDTQIEDNAVSLTTSSSYIHGGGGLFTSYAIATMNGGTVRNNRATTISASTSYAPSNGGAGLYFDNSDAAIQGVTISGNVAAWGGGGLLFYNPNTSKRTLTVDKGTVVHGNTALTGGGIQISGYATSGSATSSMNQMDVSIAGTVRDNASTYTTSVGSGTGIALGGGGIDVYISRGDGLSVTLEEACVVTGNTSAGAGGGISMYASNGYDLARLTIKGVVDGNTAVGGGGVYAAGTNVIISDNGSVSGNSTAGSATAHYGGGVYLYYAQLAMRDKARVNGNVAGVSKSVYGGGVLGYLSAVNVYDSATIDDNACGTSSTIYGGGLYLAYSSSVLSMNGGSISGNACGNQSTSSLYGGAVYSVSTMGLNIRNARLNANACRPASTMTIYGGAVHFTTAVASTAISIAGSEINGNAVGAFGTVQGGGMYVSQGSSGYIISPFTLSGTEITGNAKSASGSVRGGGLYLYGNSASSKVNVTIGSLANISENAEGATGVVYGGGVYAGYTSIAMTGGSVNSNARNAKNAIYGGGICLYDGADGGITGGSINGNATGSSGVVSGGGVYFRKTDTDNAATLQLTVGGSASISSNAATNGGGIYMVRGASSSVQNKGFTLVVSDGAVIASNTATGDGGGIWAAAPSYNGITSVIQSGGSILNNTSGGNGGGIYIAGRSSAYVSEFTASGGMVSGNKTPNGSGQGIYVGNYTWFYAAGNAAGFADSIYLYSSSYPVRLIKSCQNSNVYPVELRVTPTTDATRYKRNDNVVVPYGDDAQDAAQFIDFFALYESYEYILIQGDAAYGNEVNIILGRCVFIDSVTGSDTNTGVSPALAVATFIKAKELLQNTPGVIVISGPVIIAGTETWTLGSGQSMMRYNGFAIAGKVTFDPYLGDLVVVNDGAQLSLGNLGTSFIGIDGSARVQSAGTMVRVKDGGTLLVRNAALTGNNNYMGDGGAIYIEDGGYVEIGENGGAISNCNAARGSAIYQGGRLALLGKVSTIGGDVFLAKDKFVDVNDHEYALQAPLSITMADAKNGRAVVVYNDIGDAAGEENRYQLSADVTALFRLVVREQQTNVLELKIKGYVYVDGISGDDLRDGMTPETSVRTIQRAYEVLRGVYEGSVIFVVQPVTIPFGKKLTLNTNGYTEDGAPNYYGPSDFVNGVYIHRYSQPSDLTDLTGYDVPGNTAELFIVKGELTLDGMTLDGHVQDFVSAVQVLNAPGISGLSLVRVDDGGSLTVEGKGALLCSNASTGNAGAVNVTSGGEFWFKEGTIQAASAQNGGGIYVEENASCDMWDNPGAGNIISTSRIIQDTSAALKGGAICIADGGEVNIQASALIRRTAAGESGGMIYQGGALKIKDRINLSGEIHLAKRSAGQDGHYIDVTGSFVNEGNWIINPEAPVDGRAIALYDTSIATPGALEIARFPLTTSVAQQYLVGNRAANARMLELQIRQAVYIDGIYGDDGLDGTAPVKAVRTLARAWELLKERQSTILYVVNPVTIGSAESIELRGKRYSDGDSKLINLSSEAIVRRYSQPADFASLIGFAVDSNLDALFRVAGGGSLSLNLTVEGHAEAITGNVQVTAPGVEARSPMIEVQPGGQLTLNGSAVLINNGNHYAAGSPVGLPGGALYVAEGGYVDVMGASILNNSVVPTTDSVAGELYPTIKGSGIYLAGQMVIQNLSMTLGTLARPQTVYLYADPASIGADPPVGAFIQVSVGTPNSSGAIRMDFPNYVRGRVLAEYPDYIAPVPADFSADDDQLTRNNLAIGKNSQTHQVLLVKDKFSVQATGTVWAFDEAYPPSDATKTAACTFNLTTLQDLMWGSETVELDRLTGKTFTVRSIELLTANDQALNPFSPEWALEPKTVVNAQKAISGSDFANGHFALASKINNGTALDMNAEMAKLAAQQTPGEMTVAADAQSATLTFAVANANAITQATAAGMLRVTMETDNGDILSATIIIQRVPGQIRATVPLVLVANTRLSGIDAAAVPDNYVIVNYSDFPVSLDQASVDVTQGDPHTGVSWLMTEAGQVRNRVSGYNNISLALGLTGEEDGYYDFASQMPPAVLKFDAGSIPRALLKAAAYDASSGVLTPRAFPLFLRILTGPLNFVTYANDSDTVRARLGVHAAKITYSLSIPKATGSEPAAAPPAEP
jgi:hypothetical protein